MRTGDETRATDHDRAVSTVNGGANRGDAAADDKPDRLVRLAVNLGPEAADVLKQYAGRKGISVTEAVRRAIAVLAFVDETQRRGASINVEDESGLKEVMFLV